MRSEDLWQRLETVLLRRLTDKIPQVRQRAAFAIHRLSDPSEEQDPVRRGLTDMMDFDSNKDCRREALKSIDLSRKTVKVILRRCRDTSDEVRRAAFERLHQVDIRALSIRQRVDLLKSGLTERSESVKKSARDLLIERWLKNRNGNIIELLKLLDIEQYESEAEIVIFAIFDAQTALTVDAPPYKNDGNQFTNEHLFYWRCLVEWYSKQKPVQQQEIDDVMPDTVEFVKLFEAQTNPVTDPTNGDVVQTNYIAQQLLILARYLNFQDEFSRSSLSRAALKLLESHYISNELIPLIMKLLRKLHCDDEEDYTRLIRETVEEIKDSNEDREIDCDGNVVGNTRKEVLEERLKMLEKQVYDLEVLKKNSSLKNKFNINVNGEMNQMDEQDAELQLQMDAINMEIDTVTRELNEIETKTEQTWIRMLAIITDLIQFTHLNWEHNYIRPMFEQIIVPTVIEKRPLVRAAGLKAFSLFLQMDKTNTKNNLILFLHILLGDGPASEYFALQALFDFLMIFDLFDDEKSNEDPHGDGMNGDGDAVSESALGDDPEDRRRSVGSMNESVPLDELPVKPPKSDRELLDIIKPFLQHEDEELLVCAVEGFCKLLFLNRLKHHKLEILTKLLLLYFNPLMEENDYVRQILSVFFPYYVDPKTFPNNRQHIADCLMPCIRSCAYAPRESPLSQINTTKMTEYILWLLGADPLTEKDGARNQRVNASDPMSLHEQLCFDILFEIDAHPEADQVRVLSRILTILQLNEENQHNLKQYKVLCTKMLEKVKNKPSIKYLQKVLTKIDKLEVHPSQTLSDEVLLDLEEMRKQRVEQIQAEHLELMSDDEKEELEQEFGIDLTSSGEFEVDSRSDSMTSRKKQLRTKQRHENISALPLVDENENSMSVEVEVNRNKSQSKKTSTRRKRKKAAKEQEKKKKKPTRRIVKNKRNSGNTTNTNSDQSQNQKEEVSDLENENEEEKQETLSDDEPEPVPLRRSTRNKSSRGRGSARGRGRGRGRGKAKSSSSRKLSVSNSVHRHAVRALFDWLLGFNSFCVWDVVL